ncbi:MAG TPA: DUF3140 domain-containing protein [Geminicoccus sp.]|jgi:hypothetical protein|uniref:DUF3140 domain-containing protein n=1 Tax=Geminicoccus sp. TaxID=2024832 RepID=UPI002E316DED|nr:DUF3140 domain-containing protein [Geminicoccus sp.]HEX2528412.1 DUF3140 domain-containing protein [Geminicoccus sp.]
MASDPDREQTWKEFNEAVNMTPAALDKFLASEESKSVGWTHEGESETVGHQSGRRIVEIKRKRRSDLTDDDFAHMRKVIGYVHRHLAQGGPKDDMEHSRWRYSLMNWGHDPKKG